MRSSNSPALSNPAKASLPTRIASLALILVPVCVAFAQISEDEFAERRAELAESLTKVQWGRDPVEDSRVLEAIAKVPRHRYVPEDWQDEAYADHPLPIGHDQTISQPYIVAKMTEALKLEPGHRILEVGTGSGYQAAVLGELAGQVYTIEIVPELGRQAAAKLKELGYDNVHVRVGDGYRGWPEHAPFDGIIVTAAPDHVPQPLIDQLKPGGRMVIPVGAQYKTQRLLLITKDGQGKVSQDMIEYVRFVPMTGEAQDR